MKTRSIWEVSDIKAGAFICRESWHEDSEDISGLCSVTYKLGYRDGGSSECMCKISITDGLIISFPSNKEDDRFIGNAKQVLVDELNNDQEGYRLLTNEQVMRRMKYLLGIKPEGEE